MCVCVCKFISSSNVSDCCAGAAISVLLFCVLRRHTPPHWCMQVLLVPASFGVSIVWLNIIANEVVSVLRAFGLLLNIDTGTYTHTHTLTHAQLDFSHLQ